MGSLYFGDNLYVLRDEIKSESVDLIYLDPPFNSKRDYNLLFKTPKGHNSDAQITAFDDTWHWGAQAEKEFDELLHQQNTDVAEMIQSLRRFLKETDLMAYLTLMANRLVELHRVLKPSGSLYLHCDPTASHYLKIVLDTIFGAENFVNEIVWKRSDAHSDSKQGAKHYGRVHDVLLFYTKSDKALFKNLYRPLPQSTIDNWYRNIEPETGRKYNKADVTGPGGAAKGNPFYEWKGISRYWRYSKENMERLDTEGKLVYSKSGMPYEKRYLDESKGVAIQDWWDDIQMLRGISDNGERLGYPTQKPLALLERIIQASSNEGDVVLDPFCGCGTAVHAAETLKREWIGIDITHLAISLIEKRMKDAFPNITFEIYGTPKDLDGARNLAERDKYQFQWWACSLVNAQPYQGKKKGSDGGVDGLVFFQDDETGAKKIIVSVKGGEHVSVTMVKDLIATVEREKAAIGLFVTLATPTKPLITEAVSAGFYKSPKGDVPKIQVLTIEGLMSGKERPQYFDMSSGVYNFKKAKVEKQKAEQKKLL
jgi:DNA modification methylase